MVPRLIAVLASVLARSMGPMSVCPAMPLRRGLVRRLARARRLALVALRVRPMGRALVAPVAPMAMGLGLARPSLVTVGQLTRLTPKSPFAMGLRARRHRQDPGPATEGHGDRDVVRTGHQLPDPLLQQTRGRAAYAVENEMTKEQADQAHEVKERLWAAIHDLVDTTLRDLTPEQQARIRDQLNDEFRFWSRT